MSVIDAPAAAVPPTVSPMDVPSVTGANPKPTIAMRLPAIDVLDPVIREMLIFVVYLQNLDNVLYLISYTLADIILRYT